MKSRNSSRFGALHALLPDLSPLRTGDFRLLYFGQMISGFGSALTYVVLPIQMYQLTHSTVMVGLLGRGRVRPLAACRLRGRSRCRSFQSPPCHRWLRLADDHGARRTDWRMRSLPHPHVPLLFAAAGDTRGAQLHRAARDRSDDPATGPPGGYDRREFAEFDTGQCRFIAGPGIAGWIAVNLRSRLRVRSGRRYLPLWHRRHPGHAAGSEFRGGDEGWPLLAWIDSKAGATRLQRKDLARDVPNRHERHVLRHA